MIYQNGKVDAVKLFRELLNSFESKQYKEVPSWLTFSRAATFICIGAFYASSVYRTTGAAYAVDPRRICPGLH